MLRYSWVDTDGLAAYVTGGVGGLAPDPEGDGVSFLGGEEDIAQLREQLIDATPDADRLVELL